MEWPSRVNPNTVDGAPLAYFEYGYDAAGRIAEVLRENGNVVYYGYDDAGRPAYLRRMRALRRRGSGSN